jgi:hypothetical protein
MAILPASINKKTAPFQDSDSSKQKRGVQKTQMFVSDVSIRYPLVYPGSNGGPVLAGRKRQKQESDNSIFRVFRLGRKNKRCLP